MHTLVSVYVGICENNIDKIEEVSSYHVMYQPKLRHLSDDFKSTPYTLTHFIFNFVNNSYFSICYILLFI
jgi:hypothetical protein